MLVNQMPGLKLNRPMDGLLGSQPTCVRRLEILRLAGEPCARLLRLLSEGAGQPVWQGNGSEYLA